MRMEKRGLVIIGGGPAGLSAAIYGRRAGLDVLVIEKGLFGGQINITSEIENFPGVAHAEGMELAEAFRKHAEVFEPEFRDCRVERLVVDNGCKILKTDKGDVEAEAIIIASGASFRHTGCRGEEEFAGRGVSYCAVCDGAFFEDEVVAVIGGGNTAVEEASYLTQFASKVYIIHRRDEFRADRAVIERALANPKIVPVWNTVVDEIAGSDMVEKVVTRNVKTGETGELSVAGVFVFVGTEPNVDFLEDKQLERNGKWIVTNDHMETSVEGVFAAGDVRDKFLRQVVTAAADGAIAAMASYEYITAQLYMQNILFEPEKAVAVFSSSIDGKHIALMNEVEKWSDKSGAKIVRIDGHRNIRMRQKLGVREMPSVVELAKGNKIRELVIDSLSDIEEFCGE